MRLPDSRLDPSAPGPTGARKSAPTGPKTPYSGVFGRDLLTAVLVPYHYRRIGLVLMAAIGVWIPSMFPIIGWAVTFAVTTLLSVIWVQSAAQGGQEIFPRLETLNVADLTLVAVRALIGCAAVYLPLYVIARAGIPGWISVAWVGLSVPAMYITLAMTEGLIDAANPLYWLRTISVAPAAFVVAGAVFVGLVSGAEWAADASMDAVPIPLRGIFAMFVELLGLASAMHLLGVYVLCYREALME